MWKKRLVSMAMALVLAVSLLPTTAWAVNSANSLSNLEMYLRWSGTQTIEVTGTIEVTEPLVIPKTANITITGGGTLKRAASFTDGYMFDIQGATNGSGSEHEARLTLENIKVDGGRVPAKYGAFKLDGQGDFLTLGDGAIIQNHVVTGTSGGTVDVFSGVLTTETGSVIQNNTTAGYGGGVYCAPSNGYYGSFLMHGGKITGNTAAKGGGGVYSKSCPKNDDKSTEVGKGFVIGDYLENKHGVIRIEGNKLTDGTANNVYVGLYSKSYDGNTTDTSANPCAMQCGTFNAAKSYIGISAEIVPSLVVKHTYPDMQAAFHSDNGAYALTSGSGGLWLKGAEDGTHTHCVCGDHYSTDSNHSTHKELEWTGVSSLKAITEAGNYYLLNDVEAPNGDYRYRYAYGWQPVNGVKLCLNGHRIIARRDNERAVISVDNNATFDLTDCKGNGTVTHGEDSWGKQVGSGVSVGYKGITDSSYTYATFNLWGGSITGNVSAYSGGGVNVASGTFNMYGGKITGNATADKNNNSNSEGGGGVAVDIQGKFNLYKGEISQNTASRRGGGGVINAGTFTMYDGLITRNTVTLIGKSPYENSADYGGGGVLNRGTFIMKNGIISDNTVVPFSDNDNQRDVKYKQGGGGVYNARGTFTMENGTLSGNKALNYAARTDGLGDEEACGNGGGLYNASGATARIVSGTITGNISSARSTGYEGEGAGIYTKGTLYIGTTSSSKVEIYAAPCAFAVSGSGWIRSQRLRHAPRASEPYTTGQGRTSAKGRSCAAAPVSTSA